MISRNKIILAHSWTASREMHKKLSTIFKIRLTIAGAHFFLFFLFHLWITSQDLVKQTLLEALFCQKQMQKGLWLHCVKWGEPL